LFAFFTVASLMLGAYGLMLWPVALMILFFGWHTGRLKFLEAQQPLILLAYGGIFTTAWLRSFEFPGWSRTPGKIHAVSVAIATGLTAIAILLSLWKFSGKLRKPGLWLLLVCVLAGLIAMFSGPGGGPDPMFAWLASRGIEGAQAETIVVAFRKTVHFTFYGIFAFAAFRGTQEAGIGAARFFAITLTLAHAAFDETRQLSAKHRSGSVVDVLIDAAGMLTFLALAGAFRRGNRG
jgi:VanZ family protein